MKTPLVCLFIATVLPYLWNFAQVYGRKKQLGNLDNKLPRLQQAQLTGLGARAVGAHENAFEALILFAPTVIVALIVGVDPTWLSRLCVAFVAARVLHGAMYLADQDKLRSLAFTAGLVCVVALWVMILRA